MSAVAPQPSTPIASIVTMPKMTLGRSLRRMMRTTPVRNIQQIQYLESLIPETVKSKIVTDCEHLLDARKQPRINCEGCWKTYFEKNPAVVTGSKTIVRVFGYQQLTNARGAKFVKYFKRLVQQTT